jgi:protein-S-isoprenylcysteine O-methyltransferase Ste14
MMLGTIFVSRPVGVPGLAALVLGGLGFFALLLKTRLSAARSQGAEQRSGRSALGIALQMLGFALVGFGPVRLGLASGGAEALAEAAIIAALMAGALLLFAAATRAMGDNWSLIARTRADHRLVTEGVFARLRHPIYLAMALFLLALAAGLGHEANLILAAPLFALGTWIRVHEEEKLLRARFGDAYDRYAASVRRFIPGLI